MACSNCQGVTSHVPQCVLRRGCPACYAKSGNRCVTTTGEPRAPHAIRKRVNMMTLLTS